MTDWHDAVPALNSLLITLSIYVFLLLNVEIRNRIQRLESRRDAPPALPEARRQTVEARGEKQEARNRVPSGGDSVPSASDSLPEDRAAKDGETPDSAE